MIKNWLLMFAAILALQMHAQDSIIARPDSGIRLFIGGGAAFTNGYKISKFISQQGFEPLDPVEFNITTGLYFINNDVDIDIAYDLQGSGVENAQTKNRLLSQGIKVRAHYELIRHRKFTIGTGLNFGYGTRRLMLVWHQQEHEVDFNSPTGISGNQLTMFLEKGTIGPSISIKSRLPRDNGHAKLNLAYEIGFNNHAWKTDNFVLEQEIKEGGFAQLILNLTVNL